MADSAPSAPARRETSEAGAMPRWSLFAVSLLHALAFAAAAWVLPWGGFTSFAVLAGLLAAAHASTATLALMRSAWLPAVWRGTSIGGLGFLAWTLWGAGRSAAYLAALYGSVGQGLAVALLLCLTPVLLFTVPLSAWGLATNRRRLPDAPTRRQRDRVAGAGAAAVALVLLTGFGAAARQGATQPIQAPGVDVLSRALPAPEQLPERGDAGSLMSFDAFDCAASPTDPMVQTALVAFTPRDPARGGPALVCVQADPGQLPEAVGELLRDRAARGPVKIDVVRGHAELGDAHPLMDSLRLRPGLDGACLGRRCLAPWQLVASDAFTTHTPLPFIEDLRFGVDPGQLRARLGEQAKADPEAGLAGLARLDTASYVLEGDRLVPLSRLRAQAPRPLDEAHIDRSVRAAEAHLVAAQLDSGKFRYELDPFTGKTDRRQYNLPRQAGTTLALCEIGRPGGGTQRAIRRSLQFMAKRERELDGGRLAALTKVRPKPGMPMLASLGDTALPLIAFTSCRPWVGGTHDALISRAARLLLDMQRPDGGFHPIYDVQALAPVEGHDRLFAAGQAVFALSMVERLATEHPEAGFPPAAQLHDAVERAMDYFARDYWSHWSSQFFFAEENWHCLAARASLPHHRHDGYEQFCLDYVRFKSRLLLDAGKGHHPDLVDGYGFGNWLPPHNTTTSGLGEALAAAVAVRRARREDASFEEAQLRRALGFLLRQQWLEEDCWACAEGRVAVGGWSESMSSPKIRIDYVQHAMAAMGHGGQALGLLETTGAAAR